MKLRDLLRNVEVSEVRGDGDVEIASVVSDSRLATRGALFVAVPGLQQDGAKFIDAALQKGASVIVHEQRATNDEQRTATSVRVADARAALSIIAANFYGNPAGKLSLIGV